MKIILVTLFYLLFGFCYWNFSMYILKKIKDNYTKVYVGFIFTILLIPVCYLVITILDNLIK